MFASVQYYHVLIPNRWLWNITPIVFLALSRRCLSLFPHVLSESVHELLFIVANLASWYFDYESRFFHYRRDDIMAFAVCLDCLFGFAEHGFFRSSAGV
jgi:hypothetical protein